jgi:DNA-binding transcriptional MerR regulator
VRIVNSVELPDKLYFKIGEVARIAGVKQHVLRYWESEFSTIKPQKSKSNQRLYRRRDVEAVLAIKHLLYDRKFTIEGAKRHLKAEGVDAALPKPEPEEVEARVRQEFLKELEQKEQQTRARMLQQSQKQLLELRQLAVDFFKELEGIKSR